MADYNFLLETHLSQDQQLTLQALERICRGAGLNLYLTGGPMRDLLTGRPVRSLEITTEGDPLKLAPELEAAGAERMSVSPEQNSLRFRLRGGRLRVSAARSTAGLSTIVEDLRGRGLTLNSIGLSLNPGSRGLPLDPANGLADIEAHLIRMNHSYVFLDDPMVILRALRLHLRLDYALEERTAARIAAAREGNYLERATAAERGHELEAIAYEPDPASALRGLDKEGWLEPAFGKGVNAGKMNLAALARLGAVVESWEQLGITVDNGLLALPFILGGLAPADQTRLTQCLLSRHLAAWKKLAAQAQSFEKQLLAVGAGPAALAQVQTLIEKALPEAVVFSTLDPADGRAGRRLKDFQAAALQVRRRLPLGILRGLGLAPHSLAAEEMLRPFYRRLLSGETMSDAELADGLRAAVSALHPPAAAAAPSAEPAAASSRRRPKAVRPARELRGKAAPAALAQPQAPPAAKHSSKPAAQSNLKPIPKLTAKTAVKPDARGKAATADSKAHARAGNARPAAVHGSARSAARVRAGASRAHAAKLKASRAKKKK